MAGPISRHGWVACAIIIGASSWPSLAACLGSRTTGRVDTESTHQAAPSGTNMNGFSRNRLTMRSHWSPTMASISNAAMACSGRCAASWATTRPPIEWPANTALRMPSSSIARPISAA